MNTSNRCSHAIVIGFGVDAFSHRCRAAYAAPLKGRAAHAAPLKERRRRRFRLPSSSFTAEPQATAGLAHEIAPR